MNERAQLALAQYDRIMEESARAEYVDTGDLLQVAADLAGALRELT